MAGLIEETEVIHQVQGLSRAELRICVEAGWVTPAEGGERFLEIDVARIRLIHELRADIGIDDESLPVVLSLIDQLHGLRRHLAVLAETLQAQPEEIRRKVLDEAATRLSRVP